MTGNSTFDYDGSLSFTGGTVYINGQQTSTIPNQIMGGGGWGNNNGQFGNGGPGGWGNGMQNNGGGRGGRGGW